MFVFIIPILLTSAVELFALYTSDLAEAYHLNKATLLEQQARSTASALNLQTQLAPFTALTGSSTSQRLSQLHPLSRFLLGPQINNPRFSITPQTANTTWPLQKNLLLIPSATKTPYKSLDSWAATAPSSSDIQLQATFSGLACSSQALEPSYANNYAWCPGLSLTSQAQSLEISNSTHLGLITSAQNKLLSQLKSKLIQNFQAGTTPPSSTAWLKLFASATPQSTASSLCQAPFLWPASDPKPISLSCAELGALSPSTTPPALNASPYTYQYVYYKKTGPGISDFTLALRN